MAEKRRALISVSDKTGVVASMLYYHSRKWLSIRLESYYKEMEKAEALGGTSAVI